MDLELHRARALITGGSRGIGLAIVERLVNEGCRLEFCARTASRVEDVESNLTAGGHPVKGSTVDLTDQQAVTDWGENAIARLGGVDILVANASAMATGTSDAAWQQNYLVEIASLLTVLSVATPYLRDSAKQRGDAAVVAIASTAASGADKPDAYGATKAALVHTVKGLSHRLIEDGVRANTVSPGPVFSKYGIWERIKADSPTYFDQKVSGIPLGRMGKPEEVANVVAFLCSPLARFIVGSNFIMDGGRSARPHY
jgi:3-oxoacyl-[acyl-carrier protein] reductase